jgi:hypothetical protein
MREGLSVPEITCDGEKISLECGYGLRGNDSCMHSDLYEEIEQYCSANLSLENHRQRDWWYT